VPLRYCCERQSASDPPPCRCADGYCRGCLLCGVHCRCPDPKLVYGDGEGDEPVVVG
jgi:hypothetical protein